MKRSDPPAPVLEIAGVSKAYGALRPLRLERLDLQSGESVAIMGFDQPAAETFINLITGASLPDAGSIRVFGHPTSEIVESTDWLALLDRFGIVSERAVMLESLSVIQNLAMPFSLEIEPPPEHVRRQAIDLAREAGLGETTWDAEVVRLSGGDRLRLQLARALALDPRLVILEHPSARLARDEVRPLGRQLQDVIAGRGVASMLVTMDSEFAEAAGLKTLVLDPATGRLRDVRGGRGLGRIAFWR